MIEGQSFRKYDPANYIGYVVNDVDGNLLGVIECASPNGRDFHVTLTDGRHQCYSPWELLLAFFGGKPRPKYTKDSAEQGIPMIEPLKEIESLLKPTGDWL